MVPERTTRRQFLQTTGDAIAGSALLYGSSQPISSQTDENSSTGILLQEGFESNIDEPGMIANDAAWNQRGGPCCNDDSFDDRLYTWDELKRGDPSRGLPTDTMESTDYTEAYYNQVGGNFMIQNSGGYGNFFSSFSFSTYPDNYPDAPYQPDNLKLRVGGNDHQTGFSGRITYSTDLAGWATSRLVRAFA